MGNHARQRAATRSRRAGRTVYSEPVSEPVVRWSVPRVFFMPSERKTPPDTGTVPVLVAELGRLVAYGQLGNYHSRQESEQFTFRRILPARVLLLPQLIRVRDDRRDARRKHRQEKFQVCARLRT